MIQEPPPQFAHQYSPITEWIYPAPEVDRLCRHGAARAVGQIIGCSFKIGEHCYIILSAHAVDALRRHETAHCNGWRH